MPNPNSNFDIPKPNLATNWQDAAAQIRRPSTQAVPPKMNSSNSGQSGQ